MSNALMSNAQEEMNIQFVITFKCLKYGHLWHHPRNHAIKLNSCWRCGELRGPGFSPDFPPAAAAAIGHFRTGIYRPAHV